jgi:hypothetical protein
MTRESSKLLCAKGIDIEVRAFVDIDGSLVVTWWGLVDGVWAPDHGAKVPKEGLGGLCAFLMDAL